VLDKGPVRQPSASRKLLAPLRSPRVALCGLTLAIRLRSARLRSGELQAGSPLELDAARAADFGQ
jgi:hypothetical protein